MTIHQDERMNLTLEEEDKNKINIDIIRSKSLRRAPDAFS